ncbi:hypothetical protein HLASF_1063 [Halanaeroarchaeum sulfurireducens]|uniref:Uncharacterized protein n=1 Tax=Halanaeroarchaeum sulfurireducens TaxID=1604004 RepID=A0A0F7P9U4_9EURY|nr:hypothetical protein HLASF_1063 [Halanaeroarchaeum sulfurireducens]ALG81948.1 hypothetical protein HLASA_1052 [Halanaeroarchaeum sulfurireducens]
MVFHRAGERANRGRLRRTPARDAGRIWRRIARDDRGIPRGRGVQFRVGTRVRVVLRVRGWRDDRRRRREQTDGPAALVPDFSIAIDRREIFGVTGPDRWRQCHRKRCNLRPGHRDRRIHRSNASGVDTRPVGPLSPRVCSDWHDVLRGCQPRGTRRAWGHRRRVRPVSRRVRRRRSGRVRLDSIPQSDVLLRTDAAPDRRNVRSHRYRHSSGGVRRTAGAQSNPVSPARYLDQRSRPRKAVNRLGIKPRGIRLVPPVNTSATVFVPTAGPTG